jgi:hypothetical protein
MRKSVGGILAMAVGLFAVCNAGAVDVARVATGCGYYSGLGGYTYVESLRVTETTCATGRQLVLHRGHVRGWRCARKVLSRSPTQYIGRETCTDARRRVAYTFTQNT